MKILAYVHGYHPNHNAGSEAMLHQILIGLVSFGHDVIVMTSKPAAKEFEGIPLYDADRLQNNKLFAWADIVITHLSYTGRAVALCRKYSKPLASIIHNNRSLQYNTKDRKNCQLFIANSEWIKDTITEDIPTIVMYPPTLPDRYRVDRFGDAITLINISEPKGGNTFWSIAEKMPHKNFIGVVGAYGNQIIKSLPNVKLIKNSPEINKVYSSTRLLLIPSIYETWGRVGIEAACSGIPSIASPTPGLLESLGNAGIFIDRDDIDGYVNAINKFDDEIYYSEMSVAAIERAKYIAKQFLPQLLQLDEALRLFI